MRKPAIWLTFFTLVATAELIGEVSGNGALISWTKPFLMPLLAVWFYLNTRESHRFLRYAVLAALVFATLGDILLLFSHEKSGDFFFLLGLGAFLLAHLFYTGGFLILDRKKTAWLLQHLWWAIPVIAYGTLLLSWLWSGIPTGLHGPIMLYTIAISCTALSAINLYPYLPKAAFGQLVSGAALFILSDSLIAINRFGHPFEGAQIAVMLTYIIGQWLLADGARVKATNEPNSGQAS